MVTAKAKFELEAKQRAWLEQHTDELRAGDVPHEASATRTLADAPSEEEKNILEDMQDNPIAA
eukprot:7171956-Heterocapsa_arctica.AAC.1